MRHRRPRDVPRLRKFVSGGEGARFRERVTSRLTPLKPIAEIDRDRESVAAFGLSMGFGYPMRGLSIFEREQLALPLAKGTAT